MELAKKIKKEIKRALKRFGEHTFEDKGAREVMDLAPLLTEFKALSLEDRKKAFCELVAGDFYQQKFVRDALVDLQDLPDAEWDDLMLEPSIEAQF